MSSTILLVFFAIFLTNSSYFIRQVFVPGLLKAKSYFDQKRMGKGCFFFRMRTFWFLRCLAKLRFKTANVPEPILR